MSGMSERTRKPRTAARNGATPARRRSTKGARTREQVLVRAAELFAQHGYADVGLEQLAAACKLSKGALFAHFDSKREIYVESVSRVFSEAVDTYEPPPDGLTPAERLRHYLEWICPTMSKNTLMCRLTMRMVLDRDEELARALMPGAFGRINGTFTQILQDLKPKRDIRILLFFVYAILTLNDELIAFADIWSPATGTIVGGRKSVASLEALIRSW
jgi:AcrR family transcriptional regulator